VTQWTAFFRENFTLENTSHFLHQFQNTFFVGRVILAPCFYVCACCVMKIRILTIGQKMPTWVLTGFEDYFKRIQPFVQTQIIELPMAKRGKNDSEADILKYRNIEGDSILAALKHNEVLIALEVGGREFSTEKLAETMKGWMLEGNDVALAIGGPDGHSEAVRKAAAWHWSLSKLTLPHPMVRVMLIEQLYRAMSINNNHPYHRAG
jgi:23S rRNA (pseudouridine1915-N3)-methyltransferase